MSVIEGKPHLITFTDESGMKSRNPKLRHHHHYKAPQILSKSMPLDSLLYSGRTKLSSHKPKLPPSGVPVEPPGEDWVQLAREAKIIGESELVKEGSNELQRIKRDADAQMHTGMEPVCKSTSQWIERHTAEDMWGNTVQVLQEIDIGGTRVNQYFYETYCESEKAACNGIDTSQYDSVCSDRHVWAYANVRNDSGEEGWALVKVRSSCNCALFKKVAKEVVLDIFSDSNR